MQLWRRQLRSQIADPQLREKCVSDYVMGCKRVLFSNNWYSTGRDNRRPDAGLAEAWNASQPVS